MTCRELIEFLLEYVEDRLGLEERERFDDHLSVCPECRSYLDTYGESIHLARLANEDAVPAEVPQELIEAILRSRSG